MYVGISIADLYNIMLTTLKENYAIVTNIRILRSVVALKRAFVRCGG